VDTDVKPGQKRKQYWNDRYSQYWKARVEETSGEDEDSNVIRGDSKTLSDSGYEEIFEKCRFLPGRVLDVGCAWGRMFYIYKKYGLFVYGVDISNVMISEAMRTYRQDHQIKGLFEAEAENLPFDDDFVENIVCVASFDATFQKDSLKELLRVLKIGGQLYLTGKNSRYFVDDQKALDAEIGARERGHPNFFSDVSYMVNQVESKNHKILKSYYFLRRGDFAKNEYVTNRPETFYEWLMVIEKGSADIFFKDFSRDYSETFKEVLV